MKRIFFITFALMSIMTILLSGSVSIAAEETVSIYRDDFGVPHIFAENNWGVFYGAGYAMAQDRLGQMNQFRLLAHGRLAEFAGPDYLASDCQVRRNLGGRSESEKVFSNIGSPYREWLEAYSYGINQAINDMGLQNILEPWSPVDSVAIARYMVWEFSHGKVAEYERLATLGFLLERFDKETAEAMLRDLMSPIDEDAIPTIPAGSDQPKHSAQRSIFNNASHSLASGIPKPDFVPPLHSLGSNAVAISSSRSATGKALLVSNTQLEIHFPAVYYEQHLCGGDFDIIGFTMPAFPPIGFGHNDRIAWTITVGCSDQQDVYEETIRKGPRDQPQYLFKGEWLDCPHRKEIINIKGYPDPVTLEIFSTIHGPIAEFDFEDGRAYTTRWGRSLEGNNLIAFWEMNRAKTIDDFAKALSKVEMSFNFLYADVDGNIGYWHAGELPLRVEGHSGVMPISGTGDYEWQGLVPFDQLPHYINPEQGIILLENNKPTAASPEFDAFLMNWGTQRIERMQQIADKLPEKVAMDDLEAMIEDTRYLVADKLKPELLRVARTHRKPGFRPAAEILEKWDNTITDDSAGALIFFVWLQNLGREMLEDEFGEHCLPPLIEKPHLPIILRAFEGKDAKIPLSRDYFDNINTRRVETKDQIIAQSLFNTMDYCKRFFMESDMTKWRWGDFSYWPLGPFGKAPNLYMDPNRHHTDVIGGGASMQLIEACPGFPNARNLMPPGNSGNPESPHAADQVKLFAGFDYKPMLFDEEVIREKAVSHVDIKLERP